MIADREASELAKHLIAQSCKKQNIQHGQLTLHADRGASMKSKPVAFLLADLGVTKTVECNTYRRHFALQGLTPMQYIQDLGLEAVA